MDKANYHSTTKDKVPNTGPRKDIQEWLRKNCNEYDPTETIPELLPRVAMLTLSHYTPRTLLEGEDV
jgi:hypothetical protein